MALYVVYYVVNLTACVLCGWHWRGQRSGLRWQWVYLLLNLLSELVCHYMESWGKNYTFLYHFVIPLEYGFLVAALAPGLLSKRARQWAYVTGILFGIASLLNGFWLDSYFIYNYDFLVRCGLVVVLVSRYFYELNYNDEVDDPSELPEFWIGAGFLLFCVGTFFLVGLYALIRHADATLAGQLYVTIMPILNVLLYCAYVVAALCNRKKYSYSWSG